MKELEKEVEESKGLSPNWHCPARLSEAETKVIKDTALNAFHTIGCVDLSRVDIMLGKDDVPYVLEVNPLPGFGSVDSNFPYIAKCAGLSYSELMNKILEVAVERHNKNKNLTLQERRLR